MSARKASDEQLIEALSQHPATKVAEMFGMHVRRIYEHKARLARKGFSPEHDMTHTVPDGYKVKGVSTYYSKDGKPTGQWVKSTIDEDRQRELFESSCKAAVKDLPVVVPKEARGKHVDHLMTVYPIGDPHFGEYIWGDECGRDWDLSIAERIHCQAMAALVDAAPKTERALIINLGDAAHYDSMIAVTPRSGHHLDADSRYAKMVDVLILAMRQVVESALKKHRYVHVVHVIGNHDETGAVWLSRLFAHLYSKEPRVTVETSPSVFSYYRWGKTLIGMHHGHTAKAHVLPGVMATDRAKWHGTRLVLTCWKGKRHEQKTGSALGYRIHARAMGLVANERDGGSSLRLAELRAHA
ncbi:oxidoreductase [Pseudomonas aeruginosa]|uniref:oxidoreductase n=1 Tax=Pseudomonas aeruginosa TaxID=287 RepID=UPI000ADE2D81|nr:oxidoreductase [Pseudomonas aeruginosa]